jgi:glutathione S-transferase
VLRLHYVPGTAAMAPHAALAEAGVEYTLVLVASDEYEPRPSAYLALNPWGQVPTLEDGDLVLAEAAAIMMHIADRFPAAGLAAPVGTRARSQISQWLAYLSTAFQTAYMRWFYPDRFTTDPDGSAGVRAAADAALRRHVEWADAQLAGRDWLVGGERSAADIYLFMMTRWGRRLEPPAWDSPHLGAHFARMLERPGVRRMMTEQGLLE